jgi:hypothetical protein
VLSLILEQAMPLILKNFFGIVAAGFVSTVLPIWSALGAENRAPIPNLSGQWGRNTLNLEVPLSGTGPIMNTTRKADGTVDGRVPVGDYASPILKTDAATILKERGEISLSDKAFPSPHNQCWPEPPPFNLAIQFGVQILQHEGKVILHYLSDHQVRHIRMNAPHRADMIATWQGDSVGHYEGDTLVIDTIGIKVGPFSAIDRNGTPHSEALHIVERYQLIDGPAAREAVLRHESLYRTDFATSVDRVVMAYGRGPIDPDTSRNGLQVTITVEDQDTFTEPWSALVTYRPVMGNWPEAVCAENPRDISGVEVAVPVSARVDF